MISMSKPNHKFFERTLDNDLDDLKAYLIELNDKILNGNVPNIDYQTAQSARAIHDLGNKYNIFQFHNESIYNLYYALREMVLEACDYYNINFKDQKYMVQGWFNMNAIKNPELEKNTHYHDHLGGTGIPNFHGYYCVDAEPSSTYYKIGGHDGITFENINKNNKAIISETGHPHGIGPWEYEKPRITIAYDVSPLKVMGGDLEQHWVPLA